MRRVVILCMVIGLIEAGSVKQLFNVTTVAPQERSVSLKQKNYGFIVLDSSRVVDISPRYSGYIERLYADRLYYRVKRGDILAEAYSPKVRKAKEEYLNSLNYHLGANRGMVESSRSKLELLGLSTTEIDSIKEKKSIGSLTKIISPIDGLVIEKNINRGSAFKEQKRVFRVASLDTLWVEARIYQEEIARIDRFSDFNISYQGREYRAKKLLLYPILDPKEATATLRLEVDNSDGSLKVGSYVTITSSTPKETKLILPRRAVIRKDGRWYAFLAMEFEGEYEPVQIGVEPLNSREYIVKFGLTKDDRVVDNALFMMDSDAQISETYR
jgi:Cu(I)/Ag(I) efflux system membrane fusion protein